MKLFKTLILLLFITIIFFGQTPKKVNKSMLAPLFSKNMRCDDTAGFKKIYINQTPPPSSSDTVLILGASGRLSYILGANIDVDSSNYSDNSGLLDGSDWDTISTMSFDTIKVNSVIDWVSTSTRYTLDYDTIISIDSTMIQDGNYHLIIDSSAWTGTFDILVTSSELYMDFNTNSYTAVALVLSKIGKTGAFTAYRYLGNINAITVDAVFYGGTSYYGSAVGYKPNSSIYFWNSGAVSTGDSPCYLHLRYSIVRYK